MHTTRVLIIVLLFPFIEYYTFVAIHKVLQHLPRVKKRIIWIVYFILSLGILLSLLSIRHWTSAGWPSLFLKYTVSIFIGMFMGKFLTAVIMFFGDVFLLLHNVFKYLLYLIHFQGQKSTKAKPVITRSQFISKSSLLFGAALTGGLAYGMTNRYRYKIRRVQIPVNDSTIDYKGLRIVQISDIHSGSFDNVSAVMEGIESIGAENPDLILFTGDLVNVRSSEILPYLNMFGKINAPLGVYSILGNHDYGDYLTWPTEADKYSDFLQLQAFHKAMGWQLLMNENRILTWNDKKIALIGVENWSAIARFPRHGDLKKAMTGLERSGLPLKIIMSHDPSHWDAEIRPNYPDVFLTLSGHTHGMQFGIEIPGFKWSPAQYMYKQWAGLYHESSQYLYVNRGFGFIGYEGRLGILPEITVLDFV